MGKIDQGHQGDPFSTTNETGTVIRQLEALPFIETSRLFTFSELATQKPPIITAVNVDKIMSAPNVSNWALGDHERVIGLLEAIRSEEIDLEHMELPQLFDVCGLYGILNEGRHRTAAMKLQGIRSSSPQLIKAEVLTVKPFKQVFAFKEADYLEILKRRNDGLWQGSIDGGPSNTSFSGFYASGEIESYVGPWVFSREMDKAKTLFEACQKL